MFFPDVLFAALTKLSTIPVSWIVVEWPWRYANCSGLMRWAADFFNLVRRSTSNNSLAIVFSKEIGLWFVGICLFFPGFGIITTFACFQDDGKCSYRKQQLMILVKCNNVLFDRCQRAVFGILSGPGAFFLGSTFITSHTSVGEMGWTVLEWGRSRLSVRSSAT